MKLCNYLLLMQMSQEYCMVVKNYYMYLSYSGQYFHCLHYCYYYYHYFVVVAVVVGVGAAIAGVLGQRCWLNAHEKTDY